MVRILFVLGLALILLFPALAQDEDDQEMEMPFNISFERGEGEVFDEGSFFLLQGDKIERSFRPDYYLTQGSLELDEGTWSIIATGFGGSDRTMWATTDIEIDASPTRCLRSLGDTWVNAFRITCPLRFLNFEVKTGVPLAILLVIEH